MEEHNDYAAYSAEELHDIVTENMGCLHANLASEDMLVVYNDLATAALNELLRRAKQTRSKRTLSRNK